MSDKAAKETKVEIPPPERQAWRVREFCENHRISRASLYKYAKLGKIRLVRFGGRTLIPASEAARIASEGLN